MANYHEPERLAARLRQQLRAVPSPELKLFCGLAFFARFHDLDLIRLEPLLREFAPALADASHTAQPQEFLPQDLSALSLFLSLLAKSDRNAVNSDDRNALESLQESVKAWLERVTAPNENNLPAVDPLRYDEKDRYTVKLRCLFVEDYPEFDLQSRGRILTLQVCALSIPKKAQEDTVEVQSPVEHRNDLFLLQARDSVKAARTHLSGQYALNNAKRYRIDFKVDTTGARFTGDSLGLAFAVGAICAISRIEVFSETTSIPAEVAFSGALASSGQLAPISPDGLRLKIERAFYSDLKCLVIPQQHFADAQQYLRTLEAIAPKRKLELVGTETLRNVTGDSRFLKQKEVSKPVYWGRMAWKARRSSLLEAAALAVLLLVAAYVFLPMLDRVPAKVVTKSSGFEVQNQFSRKLWEKLVTGCDPLVANHDISWVVADLGLEPGNEVIYAPVATQACSLSGWFYVYDCKDSLLFSRNGRICDVYPTDSISRNDPDLYEGPWIKTIDLNGQRIIVCMYNKTYPARGYITLWSAQGDSLGWYLLSGTGSITEAIDIDNDGFQEMLGFAFWNRLNCVGFFVLPVTGAYGVSPPFWKIGNGLDLRFVERGNHKRFIALPLSFDVGKICNPRFMQEWARSTQLSQNEYRLTVCEFTEGQVEFTLDFYVDRNFRCKEVKLSDVFRKKRQTLIEDGKIKDIPLDIYCDMLRDSVRYWLSPADSMYTTEGQLRAMGE